MWIISNKQILLSIFLVTGSLDAMQECPQRTPIKETMLQHLLTTFFETPVQPTQVPSTELEYMILENHIDTSLMPILEHFFPKNLLQNEVIHKKILEYCMRIFQISQSITTMEEEGNQQLITMLQLQKQMRIKSFIATLYREKLFSSLDASS